ncbi:MAG: hypothetical protein IKU34_06120 [Clostridia bacterium]|nr:hypothetical protein [Clostridia bacterium]
MLKSALRLCAGAALCALLVFAPELFQAVRALYTITVPERVLLRLSLCAQSTQAADAFYRALNIYMKEHPSIHLRITRSSADSLFASSAAAPDLYVFPQSVAHDDSRFLPGANANASCAPLPIPNEDALLCGVSIATTHPQQALSLFSYLTSLAPADAR